MAYLAQQFPQGWAVVEYGLCGSKVLTDWIPSALACEVVDLLRNRWQSEFHAPAVALAFELMPSWRPPSWVPQFLVDRYGPDKAKNNDFMQRGRFYSSRAPRMA